jgi:hypothetical protein
MEQAENRAEAMTKQKVKMKGRTLRVKAAPLGENILENMAYSFSEKRSPGEKYRKRDRQFSPGSILEAWKMMRARTGPGVYQSLLAYGPAVKNSRKLRRPSRTLNKIQYRTLPAGPVAVNGGSSQSQLRDSGGFSPHFL